MKLSAAIRGMESARFDRIARSPCDLFSLCQREETSLGQSLVWRRVVAAGMSAAAFIALERRGCDQLGGDKHVRNTSIVLARLFEVADCGQHASDQVFVANDSRAHRHGRT